MMNSQLKMFAMRFGLFFCLLLSNAVGAQSYIVNGGFERVKPLPKLLQSEVLPCQYLNKAGTFNALIEGWNTFLDMTPDVHTWDSLALCPHLPKPRRGRRMLGLILYHPFQDTPFDYDYHEFVQGSLAKPLTKGQRYRFTVWAYTSDSLGWKHLQDVYRNKADVLPTYCGNFGVCFSPDPINPRENYRESIRIFDIRPTINIEEVLAVQGAWTKLSLAFIATEAHRYFVVGNFFSDAITATNIPDVVRERIDMMNTDPATPIAARRKRIAYYCFDDFSLVEETESEVAQQLKNQQKYTLGALLFETGDAVLKPQAEEKINALAEYLTQNAALRMEIGGYTDDLGLDADNLRLSEARAKSVYTALLLQKVNPAQLTWRGYGEADPVAPNNTEEGRQQNRRVTCRVVRQ